MANHLPLVTTLRTGTLKVYKEHAVIFSMMIDSSQSGILNVSTKNVTVLLETFCPIQFDANIHGAELMQTPLRIESPLYGEYKIDNEVFAALTPNYRGLLQNHLSKHKVGCITKNFLHSLGRRAA